MNYQILANKWRPKDFTQVVSQDSAVTILKNSLDNQKLHHAYLFTGTRGIGKTTIARVFAKSLVCERGISSNPCNTCELCVGVNESRCLDVIEIDAASRTKVEDTRVVLDNLAYAPSHARFKIYIIDEVHMLSNHSFNALLKSLEEPPMHVKFILATTDPQKLPITVLSRCLQFRLKLFQINDIIQQLEKILSSENISFEREALTQIAKVANGSMRDALSLLEQILAFSDHKNIITYSAVNIALHIPQVIQLLDLLKAIINSNISLSLKILNDLIITNCDPSIILQELQIILKDLVILQLSPDYYKVEHLGYKEILLELSNIISAEDLQLYYEIVINSFKNLAFNPDLRSGLEMMILRMMAFRTVEFPSSQDLQPKNLKVPEHQQSFKTDEDNLNPQIATDFAPDLNFMEMIPKLKLSRLAKELVENSIFECIGIEKIKMLVNIEQKLIATENNLQIIENAFNHLLRKKIKIKLEFKNFSEDLTLQTKTFRFSVKAKAQQFINNDHNIMELIKNFDGQVEKLEDLNDEI